MLFLHLKSFFQEIKDNQISIVFCKCSFLSFLMGHRIVCDVLDNNEDGDHGDNEKDDDHGNDDEEDDDGDGECGDRGLVVINKQRAGQTEFVCTPVLPPTAPTAKFIYSLCIMQTAKRILTTTTT